MKSAKFIVLLVALVFAGKSPDKTVTSFESAFTSSGDTVTFEEYGTGTVITDQYISHGMFFSGVESGQNPVIHDYGPAVYTRVLHSYDWFGPLKITFIVPGDSSLTPQPVTSLSFDNPVDSEIDYIDVKAYNSDSVLVYQYTSTSPEHVAIAFTEPVAYIVFDDSSNTAYVIDNILTNSVPVSIEKQPAVQATSIQLFANYPNPFNPQTTIRFALAKSSDVMLKVFDMAGREVRVLIDGIMPAGEHEAKFDAADLPSGVYLYRLTSGAGLSQSRKMLLIK